MRKSLKRLGILLFCLLGFSGLEAQVINPIPTPPRGPSFPRLPDIDLKERGLGGVATQEFKTYMQVREDRQVLKGRTSFHLKATRKELKDGLVRIKDLNLVLFGVDQKKLVPFRVPGKNKGVLGFSVTKGKPSYLKYNPRTKSLVGTIRGKVSFPALRALATGRVNEIHDVIHYPSVETVLEVNLKIEKFRELSELDKLSKIKSSLSFKLKSIERQKIKVYPFEIEPISPIISVIEFFPVFRFEAARRLCIQPVRVLDEERDNDPTGHGLAFGLPGAREEWAKADINFNVRDWKEVIDEDLKIVDALNFGTSDEESDLLSEVEDDDCIEVFFIERFNPAAGHGGGATWGSGSAGAQIISSDANDNGVDFTHLAHEIGHALNLMHPGSPRAGSPAGSSGTLMCPSGFNNDNPDVNSEDNEANASNPLLTFSVKLITGRPDCEDDSDCGSCP